MKPRANVVVGADGRIVDGPGELLGLTPAKVLECSKALDDAAKRKRIKHDLIHVLYRRGWLTARGEITPAGERFRDQWRNAKWTTRQPEGALTCQNCGEPGAGKAIPAGAPVPPAWVDAERNVLRLCDRERCSIEFRRACWANVDPSSGDADAGA